MIRTVCKYRQILITSVVLLKFSFVDVVALLPESYRLVQRNSNVSCSHLIERVFLELDVQVYFSFDSRYITTGVNSLRASLLTVLRVVYAIVRLSSGLDHLAFLCKPATEPPHNPPFSIETFSRESFHTEYTQPTLMDSVNRLTGNQPISISRFSGTGICITEGAYHLSE